MSEQPTYTVILADSNVGDLQGAADAMSMVLGGVRYDHVQTIRRRTGFLGSGMDEVQARALAAALKGSGVEGFVLPENSVVQIPDAVITRNADCLPEGLRVQLGSDDRNLETVPWAHVYFVSVGRVSYERRPSQAANDDTTMQGMAMAMGGFYGAAMYRAHQRNMPAPKPVTITTDCVDIVTHDPVVHLRIESNAFNYDYLEGRKQMSSRANFGLLLGDLVGYTEPTGAVCTRATRSAFEARGVIGREARFKSFRQFDDYNRHYLTLVQVVASQMQQQRGGGQ